MFEEAAAEVRNYIVTILRCGNRVNGVIRPGITNRMATAACFRRNVTMKASELPPGPDLALLLKQEGGPVFTVDLKTIERQPVLRVLAVT
jgi:hypothetical protein